MGWFSGRDFGALLVGGPMLAQASAQQEAQKQQTNALRQMRDDDQRLRTEAETGAAVAANAQIADAKRRRRSSALGLGDDGSADGLGSPVTALTGGASSASRSLAAYYGGMASAGYGGTALGAGTGVTAGVGGGGGGGGYSRTTSVQR